MQASKTRLLDHFRWLRHAAESARADLLLVGHSFQALLRRESQSWVLEPRFLSVRGEVRPELPNLDDPLQGFAGWLPYASRSWDVAESRARFNEFARANDLPAPRQVFEDEPGLTDVVVRSQEEEQRALCRGPYRLAAEYPLDLLHSEYYEEYQPGQQLRIWYWNDRAVCGEIYVPASVIGNGASTVRELIVERALFVSPWAESELTALLARCAPIVSYHGSGLETVPAKGERVLVDHAIESPLMHPSDRHVVDLTSAPASGWMDVVKRAGATIIGAAPSEWRQGTLYTVDALLHGDAQVWFTALNANPEVQPAVYPTLMEAWMGDDPLRPIDMMRPVTEEPDDLVAF